MMILSVYSIAPIRSPLAGRRWWRRSVVIVWSPVVPATRSINAWRPAVLQAVPTVAILPCVRWWAGACPFAVGSSADSAACRRGRQSLLLAPCIPAIELVGVSETRYIFLAHRLGVLAEVGMVYSVNGINPLPPVQTHQVFEEGETCRGQFAESSSDVPRELTKSADGLCAW